MKKTLLICILIFGLQASAQNTGSQIADQASYLNKLKSEMQIEWPENRTINIVFHGHSVPAGYFKTPVVNTVSAYPNLFLQELKSIYPFAVVNVIVTAIGGENSLSGAERFEKEVLIHKPDVLFIDYGLNDRGAGLEKAYAAWDKMIKKAKDQNIKVILLTPSPDKRVDYQNPDNLLKQHSDQIVRLAKENQVGLVDIYKVFAFSYSDSQKLDKFMSQVNHPNKKGHQLITDEIIKWFDPLSGLKSAFKKPPETSKPGVYWYFMDGNLNREEMTKDLESMKEVGINRVIFLEVGIGVPRGPIDFMSEAWQDHFVHAVREAERLNMQIQMGAGPGWCGSGGPWVTPEESMQHLVFSEQTINGNKKIKIQLEIPKQRSTQWHNLKDSYYKDYKVFAVPASTGKVIDNINEKALYERDPISSKPNVKTHLPALAFYDKPAHSSVLKQEDLIEISSYMDSKGYLVWDAPEGKWTIIRMGIRVTGASTRPSPEPVIGLECNKLDTTAFANHLKNFTDILLEKTAPRKEGIGWTGFHMDSWESGAQNWTAELVEEFKKRRGYDPDPYFISYTGRAVSSLEISERFLWDLRITCQELLLENHAEFAKDYAHRNGLELTIEPYDMNPAGDLDLGAVADVIMAEFWSEGYGFETAYAVIEATSISHITGQPIVGAEVFTANSTEVWQQHPWSMKSQSDWALAMGVNRFIYHTFAHKPLGDEYRPGMTMGPYGVHWDRGQTWWPMADAYHEYISRCSHMMQQGQAVSDILYLTPEGAPMVFAPPEDALEENEGIPDKKGHGFDGCSPKMLMERAEVKDGKIHFPGATSYEILVLPNFKTMTPELLKKIISLAEQGARIMGSAPVKSPSLSGYPECDDRVKTLGQQLSEWLISDNDTESLYPSYQYTCEVLSKYNISEDFTSSNNSIRYGHRKTEDLDLYFIANRTDSIQKTDCFFRASGKPEIWIGTTGESREINEYSYSNGITTIPLSFYPFESYVITFSGAAENQQTQITGKNNFISFQLVEEVAGPWKVSFDPKWGGPAEIHFDDLIDWTQHQERGIKYYSGIARYTQTFSMAQIENDGRYFIDLGVVRDIARVKLNGQNIGVVWSAPWKIEVSEAIREGENLLEIEVANRWINRLLGDNESPDANVRKVQFDNGLLGGQEFKTGRYTFTTSSASRAVKHLKPLSSGLLGPVTIQTQLLP